MGQMEHGNHKLNPRVYRVDHRKMYMHFNFMKYCEFFPRNFSRQIGGKLGNFLIQSHSKCAL